MNIEIINCEKSKSDKVKNFLIDNLGYSCNGYEANHKINVTSYHLQYCSFIVFNKQFRIDNYTFVDLNYIFEKYGNIRNITFYSDTDFLRKYKLNKL